MTGDEIFCRVCNFPSMVDTGGCNVDVQGDYGDTHHWQKRSIFWDLAYWSTNIIRHNLDVMYIEKNVFDNVINTIMGVPGKSKDNVKSRRDLEIYCDRKSLEIPRGSNKMSKAYYCLDRESKKILCMWLKGLRFPDGYVSNLTRYINISGLKLQNMKSHDCHVFMQRLLPIKVKELLPEHVWKPLTELSMFFHDLCSTTLNEEHMAMLERRIPEILCRLEMIFPPSFFDSMEHLPIHLPYEARVGSPVQYRWMYPFER
ncbi:hypothetical protein Dimus_039638 [Dionaea muscipula]